MTTPIHNVYAENDGGFLCAICALSRPRQVVGVDRAEADVERCDECNRCFTGMAAIARHSALDTPLDEELRAQRKATARLDWLDVLAIGDLTDAAMWLQREGYRLADLRKAQNEWTAAWERLEGGAS